MKAVLTASLVLTLSVVQSIAVAGILLAVLG